MIYFKFPNAAEVKPFSFRLQPHGWTHKQKTNTDIIPPATAWLRGRSVAMLQVTPVPAKSYLKKIKKILASTVDAFYLLCVVIEFMQIYPAAEISI